jgi:hypothetical protein
MRIRVGRLDRLWAQAVKARDGGRCRRCGARPALRGLHAAHIITRRRYATRWDPANGVVLCMGCHRWAHEHPGDFARWVETHLGTGTMAELRRRSQRPTKISAEAARWEGVLRGESTATR